MVLSYIDDSGDDGYPKYSSQLFILTVCYFDESLFNSNFEKVKIFRKKLKTKYNLPVGLELHMRELIQNKKPYTGIGLTKVTRKKIIDEIYNFIGSAELFINFVNVVVDKKKIRTGENFNVLDNCLKYLIRRVENDLMNFNTSFICISDEGRVKVMNKTARKIRRYDPILNINKPIERMIEDIFVKNSKDSFFIQFSDCVVRLINLYVMQNECHPKVSWSKKTLKIISNDDVLSYMKIIKPKLNLRADPKNEYGIKIV